MYDAHNCLNPTDAGARCGFCVGCEKEELYSQISDASKDLNGCRRRLDVTQYTVAELVEMRDHYYDAVSLMLRDEEQEAAADELAQRLYRAPLPGATIGDILAAKGR